MTFVNIAFQHAYKLKIMILAESALLLSTAAQVDKIKAPVVNKIKALSIKSSVRVETIESPTAKCSWCQLRASSSLSLNSV